MNVNLKSPSSSIPIASRGLEKTLLNKKKFEKKSTGKYAIREPWKDLEKKKTWTGRSYCALFWPSKQKKVIYSEACFFRTMFFLNASVTTDYHFHTRLGTLFIIESAWNFGTKKALEITQTLCVSLKFRFGFKPKSDYGARKKKTQEYISVFNHFTSQRFP